MVQKWSIHIACLIEYSSNGDYGFQQLKCCYSACLLLAQRVRDIELILHEAPSEISSEKSEDEQTQIHRPHIHIQTYTQNPMEMKRCQTSSRGRLILHAQLFPYVRSVMPDIKGRGAINLGEHMGSLRRMTHSRDKSFGEGWENNGTGFLSFSFLHACCSHIFT